MDSVFMLWHSYEVDGDTEQKLIGVYKTHEDAEAMNDFVVIEERET